MSVRLEHDPDGAHRSSFRDFEDIGPLVRAILSGDVVTIVVTDKDREMRFIPEHTSTQASKEAQASVNDSDG